MLCAHQKIYTHTQVKNAKFPGHGVHVNFDIRDSAFDGVLFQAVQLRIKGSQKAGEGLQLAQLALYSKELLEDTTECVEEDGDNSKGGGWNPQRRTSMLHVPGVDGNARPTHVTSYHNS